ncbi:sensor histidine kinase [Tessaracoccus flavus]|nr:histidine kinase [Tessaracoccus flavus]SDY79575.1 Signal transduction histidine kinase [Tessaracoccus flavus]
MFSAARAWLRRPAHVDWVVAAVSLLLSMISLAVTAVPLAGWHVAIVATAAAAQSAALLRRRRAPVAVLAIGTALLVLTTVFAGDPVATELPVSFMMYAVAAHRPARTTWASVAAVVGAVGATYVFTLRPLPTSAAPGWATATLTVSLLVAVALGLTMRAHRQQLEAEKERAQQLALERDQRAQLEVLTERERIAREMHDLVAHSVAVMVTLAHGASSAMDRNPDLAREALGELTRTGSEALRDMRRVLGLLRDGSQPDGAASQTPGALPDLLATFAKVGLPVRLDVTGEPPPSEPLLHHTVYRIVQECLTNVLRHAPGSDAVAVRIGWGEADVTIEVTNTGPVVSRVAGEQSGHGLRGLRERAAAFGGSVEAGPVEGGWRVRATLNHGDR